MDKEQIQAWIERSKRRLQRELNQENYLMAALSHYEIEVLTMVVENKGDQQNDVSLLTKIKKLRDSWAKKIQFSYRMQEKEGEVERYTGLREGLRGSIFDLEDATGIRPIDKILLTNLDRTEELKKMREQVAKSTPVKADPFWGGGSGRKKKCP